MKRALKYVLSFLTVVLILIACCNAWIIETTQKQLFTNVNQVPSNNVGLVLGTSKFFADGTANLFFKYRILAAVELFNAKKIRHIIVSGDNHSAGHNEAVDMKKALIHQGIPDTCIILDFAGFRTFDSVVRCQKVFGQHKFTIISQEFHNQRALFISNYFGMEAIGYNAQKVPEELSIKTLVREFFAKSKAVLDIYFIHIQPKFLGTPIKI